MRDQQSGTGRFKGARFSRRRALKMVAVGGAAAGTISIVGCGDDNKEDTTPPPGGTLTPAAVKPLLGGTWRAALSDPQSKFDAQKFPTFTVQGINSYSYSRLLKAKAAPDDPKTPGNDLPVADWYRPVPDLASKYESPDPQTFVFTLQQGAKWHNVPPLNGRAVTPDDIVKAFDYYRSARPDKGVNLAAIDTVTAAGTNQVQIKLKQPFGPFLIILSSPSDFWIYPPELTTSPDQLNSTMVGTGPFILRSYQQGVGAKWDKNPAWWEKDAQGNALPYMDKLDFPVIPDKNQEISQFTAGRLETVTVTGDLIGSLRKQVSGARELAGVANLLNFLFFPPAAFESNAPPFNDPRVRQAVSLALDRDGLISLASGDTGGKRHNLINAGFLWYLDPDSSEMGASAAYFKRDIAKAKQLLSAAGVTSLETELHFTNNAYVTAVPYYNPVAEAIPPMLREAGINAKLVTHDAQSEWINPSGGIFFGGLKSGIAFALETPVNHPWIQFNFQFTPGNQRNHSRINDPEILGLITKLGGEPDFDKGRAIAYQIQKLNADKMYYVPLVGPNGFTVRQPYVVTWAGAGGTSFGTGSEEAPYFQVDTSKQKL